MRRFREFRYKDSNLKVACDRFDALTDAFVSHRKELERFIRQMPEFQSAMEPMDVPPDSPTVVLRMAEAAAISGLGPMAAVAGTLAQLAVEHAMSIGCQEAIVENGGDLFVASDREVLVGIYVGEGSLGDALAFRVAPDHMPIALCSSSSHMGHSHSFGGCELATVVSSNGALADCVATRVCNEIQELDDVGPVLERALAISGVEGILAVKEGRIGLVGQLPPLVRNADAELSSKVTRDRRSG